MKTVRAIFFYGWMGISFFLCLVMAYILSNDANTYRDVMDKPEAVSLMYPYLSKQQAYFYILMWAVVFIALLMSATYSLFTKKKKMAIITSIAILIGYLICAFSCEYLKGN